MGTDWGLLKAVETCLGQGLADLALESPGVGRPPLGPQVFIGLVDVDKVRNKGDAPFVAVAPAASRLEAGRVVAEVSLVLAVVTEEKSRQAGINELCHLLAQVEAVLIRAGLLEGYYQLLLPLDKFHQLKDTHPFYLAEMVARFEYDRETELPSLLESEESYGQVA